MADLKTEELVKMYDEKLKVRDIEFKKGLKYEQSTFIAIIEEYNSTKKSHYHEVLTEGLKSGKYKKPSEFIEDKMEWLFDGYIFRRHKAALCYAVDSSINWAYSTSYYKRSFRCQRYMVYRVFDIIKDFHNEMTIDKDVADILTLNLTDMERAHFDERRKWRNRGCSEDAVAYELDANNEKVITAVSDIINGDSDIPLQRFILKGIVKSNNAKMHELLGKLLLAAKLQEGLRQSICECMDIGSIAAFKSLLNVIKENNLIRFSSIKRAVGVWLGLINTDANNLERISGKSIELILECIENRDIAEEYLKSEDCMKIYIGLWSMGVYDVDTAINRAKEISKMGTHHQILTSGYFCANLDNKMLAHDLAKSVIHEHKDEQDILAVYMPHLMREEQYWYFGEEIEKENVSEYFEDFKETEEFFELLLYIYNGISGKTVDFSPCIFPWHSASLVKSDVIEKICRLAVMIDDKNKKNDKRDFVCGLLKECDANSRGRCVRRVLQNPKTTIQKETVTAMLCDKESYTRKISAEIVEKMDIEEENYMQMEAMLKYKAADMRATIIGLLCKQKGDKLVATIERLLADSKEEKRTAGLDIVMQISKDDKKKTIFCEAVKLVKNMEKPTAKEQVLIDNIRVASGDNKDSEKKSLFKASDKYEPVLNYNELIARAVNLFMQYFPDSKIAEHIASDSVKSGLFSAIKEKLSNQGDADSVVLAKADCYSLHELFLNHVNDEYRDYNGEMQTYGSNAGFREYFEDDEKTSDNRFDYMRRSDVPGLSIWKKWYEQNIGAPERLLRMYVLLKARAKGLDFDDAVRPYIIGIYGKGFEELQEYKFKGKLNIIVERLVKEYIEGDKLKLLSLALGYWYVKCLPQDKVLLPSIPPVGEITYRREREAHFIAHSQLSFIFGVINCSSATKGAEEDDNDKCKNKVEITDEYTEIFNIEFPLAVLIAEKTFKRPVKREGTEPLYYWEKNYGRRVVTPSGYGYYDYSDDGRYSEPSVIPYLFAAYHGIITKSQMYEFMFREDNMGTTLENITLIASGLREQGRQVAKRGDYYSWSWRSRSQKELLKKFKDETLRSFVDEVYEEILNEVLSVELKRGDSETVYSEDISSVKRIYGIDNLIAILTALGKDTLDRTSYHTSNSKKVNLSHLLSVCIPYDEENGDELKAALAKTDISEKRIIEAALYSPEWIDIVGEYLGYEGFMSACYYFMAHMNERFDDKRKAMIAKFTPLSEEELNDGAFDINWFKNAYEVMGQKRFETIYNAAKYISDGAKHSRARKYADATLGKMNSEDVAAMISDKRNKDLVMAYSLIPLENEDDVIRRYLFLQKFLKESKQFGSQRIASEKKAVEISMSNLAMNAGYSDVTRLTLRMETKLIDDIRELFEEKEISEVTVRLNVDEGGKAEIICIKAGKQLKSVPASLKKDEYIVRLNESKKKLTEQYRRTKLMFEQAMEEQTEFTVEEIKTLHSNPVANAIVKNLVFMCGESLGFLAGDNNLTNYQGDIKALDDNDKVIVAHPFDLYNDGHWIDYQKLLFEQKISQPFKQVFRELYVKTEEELEMNYSRRYSGHQIQIQKTVACLKGRSWVADVEDGLQKIYYKENIIARIYALADWFSPSDIEAPTLEWVEFSDRRTGMQIKIKDIPDVIFSEVMRDVDLAVSVAHVGGVDPETSHSTVEMRAALITFTLPLFKLPNVKIEKNHAIVEGHYGTYDINLGSGVIHKQGGAMINVLPVHSQHRGKIFLPFADDDPKTAEIITKVLMFAEDKKIKDVGILEQIR